MSVEPSQSAAPEAHFASILDEVRRGCDIDALAEAFHRFQDELECLLLGEAQGYVETRGGAQSKQFMVQILPHVQRYMRKFPQGQKFAILDIGPGAGHGSNLLGSLYRTGQLGYRARVSTTDIRDTYLDYMKVFCRFVSPQVANIFDIKRTYDIVIASHVVEHVPKPLPFIRRMQELARGVAIVCAPYRENRERMTHGHVNVFDDAFLAELEASSVELVESPAWGQFFAPPYKMFIVELPGKAKA